MRRFKNVSRKKQTELNKAFSEILDLYNDKEISNYKKISISVFDHWLTQDEAIREIDKISYKKEIEHNSKLHSFCISLAQSTECYLVKLLGRYKERVTFREFTSEIGMIETLIPELHYISDMCRFALVLPELNVVYFESSDFTHHIYFKNSECLNSVKDLATKNDLHIIE